MKVRVTYTATFSEDDMRALTAYSGKRPSQAELRTNLEYLGREAIGEQISDGEMKLRIRKDGLA